MRNSGLKSERINEWPADDRPREKLVASSAERLADSDGASL